MELEAGLLEREPELRVCWVFMRIVRVSFRSEELVAINGIPSNTMTVAVR